MKRNILATIGFSRGQVSFTVHEKISTSYVEIFNDAAAVKSSNFFLAEAINKVTNLIGCRISTVGVIIEPSAEIDWKMELHKESIKIAGETVSEVDIKNVLELTKRKFNNDDNQTILVQPTKFEVLDEISKSYSKAPIFKKGHSLTVYSAVTTISMETYNYIMEVAKAQQLEVSQILLTPQTISQNNLTNNALNQGAVLVHVTDNLTFVTINKRLATIANMSIYDFGFKKLIQGIAKTFNCTYENARDLVDAHATFDENENKVIHTYSDGLHDETYTTTDLRNIIKAFISKMMQTISEYLVQKKVEMLPLVISGKVWKIEKIERYIQTVTGSSHVSVYNPLSFIELKEENISTLGLAKFMNNMDELLGKQFNTIVETNPNTISSLRNQSVEKKWYLKLLTKLGGTHDWN